MASKSKRRGRVFRASCILAALIIAGSSFAWFTSSDEVTNRLTASADYGVTIAEDFTPPENWVPGQTIEKNVGVVNTGNIDAFVRTWLEGEMDILAEKRDTTTWQSASSKFQDKDGTTDVLTEGLYYVKNATDSDNDSVTDGTKSLTKITDDKLNKLGLTYSYTDSNSKIVYLKELDTTIYQNPNDPTAVGTNPVGTTPTGGFNEVMSVQAGGVLAYMDVQAGADHKLFIYKPNNSNTFKSTKGNTYEVDGDKQYTVVLKDDTDYPFTTGEDEIEVNSANNTIIVKDQETAVKYLGNHIDSDNFYPAATGLFVFRRNSDKDNSKTDPSESDYEFSGYYYVQTKNSSAEETETGVTATNDTAAKVFAVQGKYFALQYDKDNSQDSDYVLEEETYTITRDDDGNVSFYPYKTPYTINGSTYYKANGEKYYDADGYLAYYDDNGLKDKDGAASSYTPAAVTADTDSVTLFTAEEKVLDNSGLTWTYYQNAATNNGVTYIKNGTSWTPVDSSTAVTDATLIATLNGKQAPMYIVTPKTPSTAGQGVKIDIALANVGTAAAASSADAEKWTPVTGSAIATDATTDAITFYYNNDVEEGATTSKLVDSVTMDSTVTQYDYIAFDFDLNVFSDSVQVTLDNTGAEQTTSVNPWAANNGNGNTAVAAKGTKGNTATDTEITYITWAANT